MEREKFEESFKAAFDKAEVAPSDRAWVNIELELEKAKGGHLKRRLMFYQMLAAASVVFAMAIGGVAYYSNVTTSQSTTRSLASETEASATETRLSKPSGNDRIADLEQRVVPQSEVSSERSMTQPADQNQNKDSNVRTKTLTRVTDMANGGTKIVANPDVPDNDGHSRDKRPQEELPLTVTDRRLTALYTPRKIEVNMQSTRSETEVDPVVAMMARLDRREREMSGEKNDAKEKGSLSEKLWTSVGFAAGSFNTMQSSATGGRASSSVLSLAAAPIVDQEAKASGYAYSMGVNVGTKISDRWVLQGGVNYLTNSSDYTANNVAVTSAGPQQQHFRAATTKEVLNTEADELDNKILYSAPYSVNNSMRYLSIPMQAGYLLVDKTFGLQLNAGVATDLFLQNTVTPDSENLDKTTQAGGSDSPYRTFNLSGLFGTELSYRFAERYRLSLTPGIRYPFTTIYKSELGVDASPLTFDIGLRFRYIFH